MKSRLFSRFAAEEIHVDRNEWAGSRIPAAAEWCRCAMAGVNFGEVAFSGAGWDAEAPPQLERATANSAWTACRLFRRLADCCATGIAKTSNFFFH